MSTRYFHAVNSNRRFSHADGSFTFDPYELFAGSWRGILETSDPLKLTVLTALSSDTARTGVTEISKEEYDSKDKKKDSRVTLLSSKQFTNPAKGPSMRPEKNAAVVENPVPAEEPLPVIMKPMESLEEALRIDTVVDAPPVVVQQKPHTSPKPPPHVFPKKKGK